MYLGIESFLIFVTLGINFFLSYLVIKKNPKHRVHQTLSLLIFVIALWNTVSLTWFIHDFQISYLSAKLTLIFAIFIPSFYLAFTKSFLNPNEKFNKKWIILLSIPIILMLPLSFGSLNIESSTLRDHFWWHKPGLLYYPYITFFIFYVFGSVIWMIKVQHRIIDKLKKSQIRTIILGTLTAGALGIFFNAVVPVWKGSLDYDIGTPSSILFTASVAFSILRYRFLGIRIFFRKNAIQLALLVMGLSVTTYSLLILNRIAQDQLHFPPKISTALMIALITLSLPVLQFGIKRLLDRFVPREVVDFGRVADLMTESIARSKDVDDVVFRLSKEIEKSLMVDEVTFLVRDENFQTFVSVYPKQFNVRFEFDHPFIEFMLGLDKVFHLFQLFQFIKGQGATYAEKMNPIYQLLLKRKIAIIAPIGSTANMVGLVLIPERRNGDRYSPEDLLELERFFADVHPHLADVLKTGKLDPAAATNSTPADVVSHIKMDHEVN